MAIINGTNRTDFLIGTGADDVIEGRGGHDYVSAGGGADTVHAGEGHDALLGGDGNDVLHGGGGIDSYWGGAGDDLIHAQIGDFYADGGAGVDTLQYGMNSSLPVDFSVEDRSAIVEVMRFTGFERLLFNSGGGNDYIAGGRYDDEIAGGHGADTLMGGSGQDRLDGSVGDDRVNGGYGEDTLVGGENNDILTGSAGDDRLEGDAGIDTARFADVSTNYRFERLEDGGIRVTYIVPAGFPEFPNQVDEGVDLLYGIEQLQFLDRTIAVEDLPDASEAPVAVADTASVTQGGSVTLNLLANDTDPDGGVLSLVSIDETGLKGDVSPASGGSVVYTPGPGFTSLGEGQRATDSFTYTVRDADGNTAQGTATVTVTGVNDAPTAVDDAFELAVEAFDLAPELLANDVDPDRNDNITLTRVDATSALGADIYFNELTGAVVYDPTLIAGGLPEGVTLEDSFTYTIKDARGLTSTATATITLGTPGEEDPGDVLVLPKVTEDQRTGDLFNQIAAEFNVVRIISVDTSNAVGDVFLEDNGTTFIYSLEDADQLLPDSHDSDEISFLGVDAAGNEVRGRISIAMQGVDDPLTAGDDAVSATDGQATVNLWSTLLQNDVDPEEGVIFNRITDVNTGGAAGAVAFNPAAKSLVYTAPDLAPGETLTDTFSYTVGNSTSSIDTAVVRVTVTGSASGAATVTVASAPAGGGESVKQSSAPEKPGWAASEVELYAAEPAVSPWAEEAEAPALYVSPAFEVLDGFVL